MTGRIAGQRSPLSWAEGSEQDRSSTNVMLGRRILEATMCSFVVFQLLVPVGAWTSINKNRFDAVVTIKTDSNFDNCSGVLVDVNHVLTAAACVENSASKPLITIRTREISHNSNEHCDQELQAVEVHKRQTKEKNEFDIALLKLPSAIRKVEIIVVAKKEHKLSGSEKLIVTRWGSIFEAEEVKILPSTLQAVHQGSDSNLFHISLESDRIRSGILGGPIIEGDLEFGTPMSDLVVGIVMNYSSLSPHHVGCIMVNDADEWIQNILSDQVDSEHLMYWYLTVVVGILAYTSMAFSATKVIGCTSYAAHPRVTSCLLSVGALILTYLGVVCLWKNCMNLFRE